MHTSRRGYSKELAHLSGCGHNKELRSLSALTRLHTLASARHLEVDIPMKNYWSPAVLENNPANRQELTPGHSIYANCGTVVRRYEDTVTPVWAEEEFGMVDFSKARSLIIVIFSRICLIK